VDAAGVETFQTVASDIVVLESGQGFKSCVLIHLLSE